MKRLVKAGFTTPFAAPNTRTMFFLAVMVAAGFGLMNSLLTELSRTQQWGSSASTILSAVGTITGSVAVYSFLLSLAVAAGQNIKRTEISTKEAVYRSYIAARPKSLIYPLLAGGLLIALAHIVRQANAGQFETSVSEYIVLAYFFALPWVAFRLLANDLSWVERMTADSLNFDSRVRASRRDWLASKAAELAFVAICVAMFFVCFMGIYFLGNVMLLTVASDLIFTPVFALPEVLAGFISTLIVIPIFCSGAAQSGLDQAGVTTVGK